MTEPKPIYDDGTCRSSTNAPDYVAKWNPSINGEPLSKKQLHELITSQSMTIDRLLGEVAKRDDDIKVLEYANNKLLDIVIELKEKQK